MVAYAMVAYAMMAYITVAYAGTSLIQIQSMWRQHSEGEDPKSARDGGMHDNENNGGMHSEGHLEELMASTSTRQKVWWRYIDDIFTIREHGQELLDTFLQQMSAYQPHPPVHAQCQQ